MNKKKDFLFAFPSISFCGCYYVDHLGNSWIRFKWFWLLVHSPKKFLVSSLSTYFQATTVVWTKVFKLHMLINSQLLPNQYAAICLFYVEEPWLWNKINRFSTKTYFRICEVTRIQSYCLNISFWHSWSKQKFAVDCKWII